MSMVATEALIGALPVEKIRGMQKGTVAVDFESVDDLRVTIDGDTDASHVMSLVGELQAGQRVMVLFTEPHGAYVAWLLHPPAWRAMNLKNGWTNIVSSGGFDWVNAAYRRVNDVVECRGMVSRLAGPPATITEATLATLDPGFRLSGTGGDAFTSNSSADGVDIVATYAGDLLVDAWNVGVTNIGLSAVRFSVTP